ncbi:DNA polymerase III subunit alpha [Bacillus gaemokensis]|uniref:DNA polymerase III subunit alpha n=1 Tax=Bacillus gaemokensis TaxID=574375 RepID=A0A073K643_9BACI|nr:DNA polymerase III subunit alpha [Bacillus gaemokensis]KEK22025.1 DNA polymerase III DnaE [Bacillus gaemokensis]KYG39309.1 DNA polymerase III subunit alpha [Bacillus gaemokensis]
MKFVHLQCQTVYSLLKSACKIDELVVRAKELGFSSLAITDENVMYGVIPFYKACKKMGIQPIIGLTASVFSEEEEQSYPLVLLAENEVGYQNLLKISSSIMTKSKDGIPKKWLAHYAKGLIAISPGQEGEIEQLLLQGQDELAEEVARTYQKMFGSFYMSLQHHAIQDELFLQEKIPEFVSRVNIPLVATNDVRYVNQSDALVQECLLSVQSGTKMTDPDRPRLKTDQYYLKSSAEIEALFSHVREALHNTVSIAERCHVEIPFHVNQLPKFPVPASETSDAYLRHVCEEGLLKRYEAVKDVHRQRLNHELEVISRMGFSDYFLIVWDFMKYAHEHDILTGPGRGSAAGSLVSYVLEITDIDPIGYDLLFERFLNPERVTLPDIDIDFPDIRRDEMIRYVKDKYGQLRVAQIVTFGTLAAKAAIRDIARVMGLPPRDIDIFSKLIPSKLGITLKEAYEESGSLREFVQGNLLHERVFEIAKRVEGLPRHTSIHAAGVIMSQEPLTGSVAIQEGHNDVYVTQYPADVLEELGLLKMDFLGLRNLTLLENILNFIVTKTGKQIDIRNIPLQDEKTFQLLGRGDTTGVFQLESGGMRNVLRGLKPNEFEDIVAVNALYRPGPMEQIPTFIESKHGKRQIDYLHPDLEPILKSTYGVIVYQEQIMQIASRLAGFSLGEADLLRRAVSKKNRDILDQERKHFVQGCLKNGYDETSAEQIYDLIVRFANYGFNRSHAVAYSMIGYQLAYLKANYPLEFMTALLSSAIGNEDKIVQYIRETKRKGFRVLPPSLHRSSYNFRIEGNAIRYSLLSIRNIGMATVTAVIEERERNPFQDLFDFCLRMPAKFVTERNLEAFVWAGCFDDFQVTRTTLFNSIRGALEYANLTRELGDIPKSVYVQGEELPFIEQLNKEKEALGFYLSSYPTAQYAKFVKELEIPSLAQAMRQKGKVQRTIVYITRVKVIRTKKLQKMAFVTFCDHNDEMEAVVFPETYIHFSERLQEGEIVLVEGTIEQRNHKAQWIVNGVYSLEQMDVYDEMKEASIYVKIPSQYEKKIFNDVTKILFHYSGFAKVLIYYEKEHKMVQLSRSLSIHPSEECLGALREIVGEENVVVKI